MSKCLFVNITSGFPCLLQVMWVLKKGLKNLHYLFLAKLYGSFPFVSADLLRCVKMGEVHLRLHRLSVRSGQVQVSGNKE